MSQTTTTDDEMDDVTHYSDLQHVAKSLEYLADLSTAGDSGELYVYETPQIPLLAVSDTAMEARNLWRPIEYVDDQICRIDWELTRFGGTLLELTFHESSVTESLLLDPAGVDAIAPQQATKPTELGDELETALSPLVEEHDAIFTFQEVSAASMASSGHYTDFEYTYAIDGVAL